MGDEHLDTISETESDEIIKSSVEILVPIPSEFEGISDDTCDEPVYEDPSTFDTLNDHSEILSDSNDDDVILREKLLNISRLITNIESLEDNPIPIPVTDSDSSDTSLSYSDNSLPEFESFSDHTEETRSGSTTTHVNYSLPEYESFHFNDPSLPRPSPEPPDDNVDVLNEDLNQGEIVLFQNVEEDDSFTFTIRTFLPYFTYPAVSPLSCSTGSEDTIFDPGIST
ncbi:hypothetical protein Tco_0525877 [Tanacetum coccineum]